MTLLLLAKAPLWALYVSVLLVVSSVDEKKGK